jgi:hypothetical protein
VVEAPVRRHTNLLPFTAALVAVGFLVVMLVSGGPRETAQLVQAGTSGLMSEKPDDVDRVDMEFDGKHIVLVRAAGRWMRGERDLPGPVVERLQMSLRFMYAAEPVRTLAPQEYAGTPVAEFGLDPPRYSVLLSRGGRPLLHARFGSPNPQEVLQYAGVDGRDAIYLMPRFVGREWEAVIAGANAG